MSTNERDEREALEARVVVLQQRAYELEVRVVQALEREKNSFGQVESFEVPKAIEPVKPSAVTSGVSPFPERSAGTDVERVRYPASGMALSSILGMSGSGVFLFVVAHGVESAFVTVGVLALGAVLPWPLFGISLRKVFKRKAVERQSDAFKAGLLEAWLDNRYKVSTSQKNLNRIVASMGNESVSIIRFTTDEGHVKSLCRINQEWFLAKGSQMRGESKVPFLVKPRAVTEVNKFLMNNHQVMMNQADLPDLLQRLQVTVPGSVVEFKSNSHRNYRFVLTETPECWFIEAPLARSAVKALEEASGKPAGTSESKPNMIEEALANAGSTSRSTIEVASLDLQSWLKTVYGLNVSGIEVGDLLNKVRRGDTKQDGQVNFQDVDSNNVYYLKSDDDLKKFGVFRHIPTAYDYDTRTYVPEFVPLAKVTSQVIQVILPWEHTSESPVSLSKTVDASSHSVAQVEEPVAVVKPGWVVDDDSAVVLESVQSRLASLRELDLSVETGFAVDRVEADVVKVLGLAKGLFPLNPEASAGNLLEALTVLNSELQALLSGEMKRMQDEFAVHNKYLRSRQSQPSGLQLPKQEEN